MQHIIIYLSIKQRLLIYFSNLFVLVVVDAKVTNITVKQKEEIKFSCSLDGDKVTWKHGNGSEITLSDRIKIINKLFVISNATPNDAGAYVCSKMTPRGRVSYQVNLRVNGKKRSS